MPTHHYPVLVWNDATGACTAALVSDPEPIAAWAPTESEAMSQLKELLDWRIEHEPWNADPDLTEVTLAECQVEVRPQYKTPGRILPCSDTVSLRVPCVTAKQQNGLLVCIVPHLSLQFSFQDGADLKSLVTHYVRQALQDCSPAQLAGRLPPRGCRLEEIVRQHFSHRGRQMPPTDRPEMKILFAVADPLLHDLGRQRTACPAYGQEALVDGLTKKLEMRAGNVLLVGESGVGKSTVILNAAKLLARSARVNNPKPEDDEPNSQPPTYRFWRGNGGRIIAGMRYLGEWQERCEEFIQQLSAVDGVFCAENLLELAQVGGQGAGDSVAAFLFPFLQRGELRMVAEATLEEVEACGRLLPGLLEVFQLLHVPRFDEVTALQVLARMLATYAAPSKLEVEPGVAALVYRLFKRFFPYSAFPGPVATFARNLCDNCVAGTTSRKSGVSRRDVIALFVKQTGLPEIFLRDELPLSFDEVSRHFSAQIIGQPQATTTAAQLITSIKTGLTDPRRPLGVLLFCGPTGVGKTALAKTLAEYCFESSGQQDRLVRLDMSEYAAVGAAQQFLQNPQGRPAPWIERVRRQPFSVVLFDEIEKAAPEVFDAILGLLDEGRLTDHFGRVTWFRSAIVIMTSNLGADTPASAGFAQASASPYESEAAKFFRPEFFNRLDAVITFNPLSRPDVEAITRKELSELASREGLAAAEIQVAWTDRLVTAIAREGYDHRFGARPLQRAIETMVVVPLARWRVAHAKVCSVTLQLDLDANGSVSVKQSMQ